MLIRLGDFTFHGGDLPGPTGFTVASVSGWTGGPGVKRDAQARQNAPGSFRAASFAADRIVSWSGAYHGSSLDDVQYKADALAGVEGRELRVAVAWPDFRWVDATVDRVRFAPEGALPRADYQVDLWLPDPFKYGESRSFVSSGADVQLWHRGNAASWPVVTVSGSFPSGYRIVHPGGSFRVGSALSAGSTDVVDFRRGTVHRNGVLLSGVVLTADRRSVPGGVSVPMRVEAVSSGSGQASFAVVDTFL